MWHVLKIKFLVDKCAKTNDYYTDEVEFLYILFPYKIPN